MKDIHSTYNGVGKSLLVELLHFCLGAGKNKGFEEHLKGWCFILTFEHAGMEYLVSRVVGEDKLAVNGREMKLSAYKDFLNTLGVFDLPASISALSFRALLSFFLRSGRKAYASCDGARSEWKPYYRVLYQSFLLGLDCHRVVKKHDAKKKLDERTSLAKKYKEDAELRDFYLGEKNADIELASLNEQIAKLRNDLSEFQVANDFSEREAQANNTRFLLVETRNEEAILGVRLRDIDLALELHPDVAPDRVRRLYDEANIVMPASVTKRFEEVEVFYSRLRENRTRRLEQERTVTLAKQSILQSRRIDLERELDSQLQFLDAHRALDEYVENSRFLSELTARQTKIQDYLALIEKYTNEAQMIRAEMGQATVETTVYLEGAKAHRDMLMETYRGFAREFYGNKAAGLIVKNNDKPDNQIRYDIEARIEYDQADGINDVRIFCFDLLLLFLRQSHSMEFLFHDSRLFAGMDWHQRLTLFRVADRVTREKGWQYIATVNEDQIDSVKVEAGTDFDRLFVQPRVLELTDEPDGSGKLLGVQVDMQYEKP
ncbi:DUF2326 domain-containing protein [Singulisphaera acidiphila]|uniref:DUF2326 domain-containing protein n=1 Tax=Singulisphaera acidiphila TaxID=466153 RepID=UPI001ED95A5F|nr:DUF2326 domain-containing protein [Singulisphaera acidiphila]